MFNKFKSLFLNLLICLSLILGVGDIAFGGPCEGGLHQCILSDGTRTCDCPPIGSFVPESFDLTI